MDLGEPDDSGRRRPVAVPGSEFDIECDTVIVALGQSPNPLIRTTTEGLTCESWGGIRIDAQTGMTSIPGVFAGGDAVTGEGDGNQRHGRQGRRRGHRRLHQKETRHRGVVGDLTPFASLALLVNSVSRLIFRAWSRDPRLCLALSRPRRSGHSGGRPAFPPTHRPAGHLRSSGRLALWPPQAPPPGRA